MEATQSSLLLISQVFSNFALGIGALLAGGGGLKILLDWTSNSKETKRRHQLEMELKAKYPPKQNGKTFQLIQSEARIGMIFLLDKETSKKHHIASLSTFRKLGYDNTMVKTLKPKEFVSIEDGDEFLTQGELYS